MNNFTIGISSSSIERCRNRGIVDGMGHYTKQLIHGIETANIPCKKFAFPRLLKKLQFKDSLAMPFPFPVSILTALATQGAILKFNPHVDLFHSTDFKLIPMTCPSIMTLHDVMLLEHPEFESNIFRGKCVGYLTRQSLRFADHVIAISQYTADRLMQHTSVKEKNMSVIHLSADDAWFDPILPAYSQQVLTKYNLPQQYFLSVGTLQPKKNFSKLIDAYLSLPPAMQKEYALVIVGKYGWNCDGLLKRLQLLQAESKIIWLSNVDSDDELRCIYKGASVFVFPSLYEGFGIPLVEAFASGVPVVSSNCTSLPEVSAGAALEVNPEVVGELAEAMKLLASDCVERAKRIDLGRARASELRWSQTFEKTLGVYQQVLGAK